MTITEETTALITGAGSGIGRALALELAARGAVVVLVGRREEPLAAVAGEIEQTGGRALALPCDVTVRADFEAAVKQTIERFGRLDLLINNAGRGNCADVENTPEDQLESIFRVNVFSLWYGTAPAIRHMKERGSGMIVNISSMGGKMGFPANAAYIAAKHAVVGFTRALRTELVGTGVEAMVVCPAGTLTDWAVVTEGGPLVDLFAYEGKRGAEIAKQENIETLPPLPLLPPEEVAISIVHAIEHPEPEVYTHQGSRELALRYEEDQEWVEQRFSPFHRANREGYERIVRGEKLS